VTAAFGWLLALVLAWRAELLRRRLDAVGDAEHELRGALTAFAFVPELGSEMDRARAALADLAAARHGERRAGAPEPLPIDRLARAAAAAWEPAARALGRRIEVHWEAGPARVPGDRGRIAQALGNVLANAVEHGSGPISLRATRDDERVRLEVANQVDRGRGLRIATRAVEECGGTLSLAAIDLPLAS
jgi:signal transduction histidine kinase